MDKEQSLNLILLHFLLIPAGQKFESVFELIDFEQYSVSCSQCHIHLIGQYLQVFKHRPIFIINCCHKCCLFQNNNAFLQKNFVFKSENKHQYIEFDSSLNFK